MAEENGLKEKDGCKPSVLSELLGMMIHHGTFKLSDGTECRNASVDGANIKFEYKNCFGWQMAWMPPDTTL